MDTTTWQTMNHWNQALELGLGPTGIEALQNICSAIATDDRATKLTGGCSRVWTRGRSEWAFSPDLVQDFVTTVETSIRGGLRPFLRALGDIREVERACEAGVPLAGEQDKYFSDHGLNDKQTEYATEVLYAIGFHFGFAALFSGQTTTYWDRGLLRTVVKIAKQRHPRKRSLKH